MVFSDTILTAFESVKANRVRSGLSVLGIAVGVFTVMTVMTAIAGLFAISEKALTDLGAFTFELQNIPPITMRTVDEDYRNRKRITMRQGKRFKESMKGKASAVSYRIEEKDVMVSYQGLETEPVMKLVGVADSHLEITSFELNYGRPINADDVDFARPVTVIGADLEKELFPNKSPIGKTITVDGKRLTVVGVLRAKGKYFGASQDGLLLIPITRFAMEWGMASRSIALGVRAESEETRGPVMEEAIGVLRGIRGLLPEDENDFDIVDFEGLREGFDKYSIIISVGGFVASVVALVAAGVGIMNIMLVCVTERTREIGIRRALGSRKVYITRQFLIEALLLCQIGGMTGILLGVGAGNAISYFVGFTVVIPWKWVWASVSICALVGVGFGIYPALKAARLEPVIALRR